MNVNCNWKKTHNPEAWLKSENLGMNKTRNRN